MIPHTNTVYSVTVIDLRTDPVLGLRRTPAVYTTFSDAQFAVVNNLHDLADDASYQFAVIECTKLNEIRPNLDERKPQWWYKYNSVQNCFTTCSVPAALRYQTGFGIG